MFILRFIIVVVLNFIPLAVLCKEVSSDGIFYLFGLRKKNVYWDDLKFYDFLLHSNHLPLFSLSLCLKPLNEDEEELDQGGGKKSQGRRKPAYSGGLVLEPKKGESFASDSGWQPSSLNPCP